MRGPVAEGAKIIAGRNKSPAKVALPDPVHHHPGGEGVFRAGNPLGQLKPSALRCINLSSAAARNNSQEASRGFLAQVVIVSSDMHAQIGRLAFPGSHDRQGISSGDLQHRVLPPHRRKLQVG